MFDIRLLANGFRSRNSGLQISGLQNESRRWESQRRNIGQVDRQAFPLTIGRRVRILGETQYIDRPRTFPFNSGGFRNRTPLAFGLTGIPLSFRSFAFDQLFDDRKGNRVTPNSAIPRDV